VATGNNSLNEYLVKVNSSGTIQWAKEYWNSNYDFLQGTSIDVCKDGGYIITAYAHSNVSEEDIYVIKTDSAGNVLWSKSYGVADGQFAYSAIATADSGCVLLCGGIFSGIQADICLVKMDSMGTVQWFKRYGGTGDESAGQFLQLPNGDLLICGYTESYTQNYNDLLFRTDMSGNILMAKTYQGGYLASVKQSNDKGFAMAGLSSGGMQLIKTDSLGFSGCQEEDIILQPDTIPFQFFSESTNQNVVAANVGSYIVNKFNVTDDTTTYCTSVGMENQFQSEEKFSISVSLNNVDASFENFETGEYDIIVVDITGRKVKDETIHVVQAKMNVQIGIGNLTTGLYLISIRGKSKSFSAKFFRE
jgi:hypothetical protein